MATITAASPRKSSNRAIFVLAIVFGLITAVLAYVAVSGASEDETTTNPLNAVVETQTTVVSVGPIAAREVITLDMVTTQEVAAADLQPGTFTTVEEVVGSVNLYPTVAGQQVLSSNVSEFGADAALAYIVPEGHRALGVNATAVKAVGGYILPGDFVDVIGAFKVNGSDTILTATLAQDAEVLAVERQPELLELEQVTSDVSTNDQSATEGGAPEGGAQTAACSEGDIPASEPEAPVEGEETDPGFTLADSERCDGIPLVGEENPDALYIVVAVTPQEAQRVFHADFDEDAEFRFTLRRTGEHGVNFMPVFIPIFGHCADTPDADLYGEIPDERRLLTEEETCELQREAIESIAGGDDEGSDSGDSEDPVEE